MTKQQFIEVTGEDPEKIFGKDFLKEIEGYADDGSDLCKDCLGTGIVTFGSHDGLEEKKCHCKIQDDMDDDS